MSHVRLEQFHAGADEVEDQKMTMASDGFSSLKASMATWSGSAATNRTS